MWLVGVVVRRYIDILIIIINFLYTPLVLGLFLAAASLLLCSFFKCFFCLVIFKLYLFQCILLHDYTSLSYNLNIHNVHNVHACRLKGNFKKVAPAIKALTNEQLVVFQEEGQVTVEGEKLTTEDVKVRLILFECMPSLF